ncbi:MAG: 4'-phosphopantetheinyl transferase superfamily protein [Alphaproteobacteria bacterium]|nr:4'-phosphopantetheinyl transferase superfamily protein [Alphaproteobacteria bacterium]
MYKSLLCKYIDCHLKLEEGTEEWEKFKLTSLVLIKGDLKTLEAESSSFLHWKEKEVLNSYVHEARRHSFLLGRYASKKAFFSFSKSHIPSNTLQVSNGFMGQPYFIDYPYHLSISHSEQFGAAMVGKYGFPFAIDIEVFNKSKSVFEDIFSFNELSLNFPKNWTEEDKKLALWSAKEALVKFLKIGFTTDMNILEILEVAQLENSLIRIKFKKFHALQTFVLKSEEYVFTICMPSKVSLDIQSV